MAIPSLDAVGRRQLAVIGVLAVVGAVGVAWGVARGDAVLVGLWTLYLLLAAVFGYRAASGGVAPMDTD